MYEQQIQTLQGQLEIQGLERAKQNSSMTDTGDDINIADNKKMRTIAAKP